MTGRDHSPPQRTCISPSSRTSAEIAHPAVAQFAHGRVGAGPAATALPLQPLTTENSLAGGLMTTQNFALCGTKPTWFTRIQSFTVPASRQAARGERQAGNRGNQRAIGIGDISWITYTARFSRKRERGRG